MTRRSTILLLASAARARADGFALARPGYRYEFPRDHFAHPEFETEWWYWTGNVRDARAGRRFGFELTFFRKAVDAAPAKGTPWEVRDLWLAHLALSDLDGKKFHHFKRWNRSGPGLAGADAARGRIWNGNWFGELGRLGAVTDSLRLDLKLAPRKPPVIHGVDGVSRKAAGDGRASHYISFTRLDASGDIALDGREFQVEGLAWMDHEFFTHQLEAEQTGWDWLSVQLDNGAELMLFRLRRRDGSIDPHSAGTFVSAAGQSRHLSSAEFRLAPVVGSEWRSAATGASYPLRWRITVPSLDLELEASTPLANQELAGSGPSPTYWEGAMIYAGTMRGARVGGAGYLEMTGYDKPIRLG
jgi:predicted secreted hydrolase